MLEDPHAGCHEVRFRKPLTLEPAAEAALEDYARVVLRGRHAQALRDEPPPPGYDGGPLVGVHVCDAANVEPPADLDVQAFALALAVSEPSNGLGWN